MKNFFEAPRSHTPPTARTQTEESPAQAIMTSPSPRGEFQTYHFNKKGKDKTHGLTPNGTRVPLERYEGPSHGRIKHHHITASANTMFSPSTEDKFTKQKLNLIAQLRDLKKRFEEDYAVKNKRGCLSPNHHSASLYKIGSCKRYLIACHQAAPDKMAFLKELNDYIMHKWFYNPFTLNRIYLGAQDINTVEATRKAYLQPITQRDVIPNIISPTPTKKRPLASSQSSGVGAAAQHSSVISSPSTKYLKTEPIIESIYDDELLNTAKVISP